MTGVVNIVNDHFSQRIHTCQTVMERHLGTFSSPAVFKCRFEVFSFSVSSLYIQSSATLGTFYSTVFLS